MSIFLLPKILDDIGNGSSHNIYFKMSKTIPGVIVSHSLYDSLCQTKVKIEKNDIGWDSCKKITNPFEFIHTTIPGYKTQVSKLTPLSRSFYKMIEMSTIFNLCSKNADADVNNNNNRLLSDYVHNLSHNVRHINEFEWYFNDNNYCDIIAGNGNPGESVLRDVNSFSTAFKSKNIYENEKVDERKEKKITKPKKYFELNSDGNNHDNSDDHDNSDNGDRDNGDRDNGDHDNGDHDNNSDDDNNESECDRSELEPNSKLESNGGDDVLRNTFKSFHLAEGPGGFIEAVAHIRKNKNDQYYGMTLINNDAKCPGWRNSKKFLENNPNVIIEKGVDQTGNLLSRDNFIHCYNQYKNSMDLVTGDGGIDFSDDFNNQEYSATKLIIVQVVYALTMQSNNGNFVLKVFDTFSNAIIDILYLLSSLYKNVYIMKPQTSRNANSERYIICKGYNLNENKEKIDHIIEQMYNNFDNLNSNLYIETIFNFKYSRTFISKIEEINIIIGKKQIDNIVTTLNLMMNKKFDKIDYYKKKHIQKCIRWCEKYNINFNKNLKSTNIFLSSI
jgi:23S rRNA U2552 (ribose-2'-O)-methylase RlmE/FtsJ